MSALALMLIGLGCTAQTSEAPSAPPLVQPRSVEPAIEAPPAHLRGRVALPAGARLYARPDYASPSWTLTLPDPPRSAADGPPRTRAFRVIGLVRDLSGGDFLALTNDLFGEDAEAPIGCGQPLAGLGSLRLLLFTPLVYAAEVSGRSLKLELGPGEWVEFGAGARLGPALDHSQPAPAGSSWRWVDLDGIRVIAPVPDDALARAWDPGDRPAAGPAGEALLRDAEGATMWLDDDGGARVELTMRNECGDHRRVVSDPAEVEGLRRLALDLFYDQSPPTDDEAAPEPSSATADFRVAASTPLRWPDGALAGEVLEPWLVEVGVGQVWSGRRCFTLELGVELQPLERDGLVCVAPEALEALGEPPSFAVSDELELGGSIELGPAEILAGDWTDDELRAVLNAGHDSSAECLRPLLLGEDELRGARWSLELLVDDGGRVETVELTAEGASAPAVEDCLRAEAYTWVFPANEGQLRVPLTLGTPPEPVDVDRDASSEPEPRKPKPKPAPVDEPRERGRIIIIDDE